MPKLAIVHHRHEEWLEAIQVAEPRLECRSWHPREALQADRAWLADAEALFTWRFPEGFPALMPRLRWIQNGGAGVDHLVAHPEIPAGVQITRADGRFGHWMARYVAGHLLRDAQRIPEAEACQREGRWDGRLLPENLNDRLALVVGFGRIGRQIGRSLRELGLSVRGFVRSARDDEEFPLHGCAELPTFLPEARLLVLCAPLTPETTGLVDARLLAHGNPELLLVNVGRGQQVVEADLLAALDAGRLGRAVLDVFPLEPLPEASPLWRHPRVTVTPHHSGPSTVRDLVPDILDKLAAYAEGRAIPGAVDRGRGY